MIATIRAECRKNYPDQFVNYVMGIGLLLGEAMAVVLGAVLAGSEYAWGTTKTMLTQRPGG